MRFSVVFVFCGSLVVCYGLEEGFVTESLDSRDVRNSSVKFNVTGLIAAVLTSLNDDYTVDVEPVLPYAKILKENDITTVLVGGSSGEHTMLSIPERKVHIAAWVDAAKKVGLGHVMAQVGGASIQEVFDLANFSASIGVGSILVLPASTYKPKNVRELLQYFSLVAEEVPNLPVFYYHVPKHSNVDLSMTEFTKIASEAIPNFKGLKMTTTDLNDILQVKRILKEDQKVFLGGEVLLAPAYLMGVESCISPAVSLFPALMRDIADAIDNNEVKKARYLQEKLSTTVESISEKSGRIAGLKEAMEQMYGIKMGPAIITTYENSRTYWRNRKPIYI